MFRNRLFAKHRSGRGLGDSESSSSSRGRSVRREGEDQSGKRTAGAAGDKASTFKEPGKRELGGKMPDGGLRVDQPLGTLLSSLFVAEYGGTCAYLDLDFGPNS